MERQRVSVIIPCYNEEGFIALCLDSILANDYPHDLLEIFVVDGRSRDRSRDIVKEYSQRYPFIRLLDNPGKTIPRAMNIGIRNAKGSIIAKIDAHASYPRDYISKCVSYLDEYGVDNVGGVIKIRPRNNTLMGKAIVHAISTPFGVGNSYFRIGLNKPKFADAVFSGCYRKKSLESAGLYNEHIARSEDIELNTRIKEAGGKILLVPDIITSYFTRSTYKEFIAHNFDNGFWVTYPLRFGRMIFSLRHIIPLIFILVLSTLAVLSFFSAAMFRTTIILCGIYAALSVYSSIRISAREHDIRYAFLMPAMFLSLHVTYGLGTLWGLLKVFVGRKEDAYEPVDSLKIPEPKDPQNTFISVVVPCRNEEKFINQCLDSIIAQTFPKDNMEVLIVDGMSTDGTRDIILGYAKNFPFIKLLDNPERITPCALNIGIRNAKGEAIVRMDAHAKYSKDFILHCVTYLCGYAVDNVGGIMVPLARDKSFLGKCILQVLSDPFGVGNSRFRISKAREPFITDTVFGGCYKKEVFRKVGYFNEQLTRGQDMEFNLRLAKSGGKILAVPGIISYYYARTDLIQFIKHNFTNGVWVVLPFKYSSIIPVASRHIVPLLFTVSLLASGILSIWYAPALLTLATISALYIAASIYYAALKAVKMNDLRFIFVMPVIFLALHISYGLGSIAGLIIYFFIPKRGGYGAEKTGRSTTA